MSTTTTFGHWGGRIASLSVFVTALISTGVLATFVLLCFGATPAADDFCRASLSYQGESLEGVSQVVRAYYSGWSARWASLFLQSAVFSRVDLIGTYPWLLLGVMFANFAALWLFLRRGAQFPSLASWLLTTLFHVAWLTSISSRAENVYWATGAIEYQLSLSSMLLLGTLLWRGQGRLALAGSIVLAFLIPGQHEVAGLFMLTGLALGTAWLWRSGMPFRRWLACLLVGGVSLAIVLASPAGQARAAQEARTLWDFRHASVYAARATRLGIAWLLTPIPVLTALSVPVLASLLQIPREQKSSRRGHAVGCVLGMVLVVVLAGCIEMLSGGAAPSRLLAWYQWIFWGFLMGASYFGAPGLGRQSGLAIVFLVALWGALLTGAGFQEAIHDVRGPAREWVRVASVALRERTVSMPPRFPAKPESLPDPGISADPTYWVNVCWTNFLKKS